MSNVMQTPVCTSVCSFVVVFTTKYCRAVLTKQMQVRLRGLMQDAQASLGYQIVSLKVYENHIVLVLTCDPDIGVSAVITKLKQHTASVLRREFPKLRSQLPCLWTRMKLVISLGSRDDSMISDFIEAQHNV